METIVKVSVDGQTYDITTHTPFPILMAEYLYEEDFDLMIADLKSKKEFVEEAKKVQFLMEKIPGLNSNFITKPFVFDGFLRYMEDFGITTSDFNHVSLNSLFDIVLDRSDRKDFETVEKILNFMLNIDSNYAPAYELYGSILLEQGELEKGKEYLEKAAKIDPWNIAALSELGETYFNLGEFEKAADIWKKEIELSPNNYVTYFMIADAFIECQLFDKAAHILEKFLNRFPKSILGKYELSILYEKLERNLEAKEIKEEIMNSIPEYSSDIEIWSKIMYEKGKYSKVINFIEKYFETTNDNEHFNLLLVVPYLKEGKLEEAKKIFTEMKEKYNWYYFGLKEILEKNLNYDELKVIS